MSWKNLFSSEYVYAIFDNGILYCGDTEVVLRNFKDECVDLVITSPPYDDNRLYEAKDIEEIWNFDKFTKIAKELYRVMKEGGVVVWIVQDTTKNYSRTGTSFKQALYFKEECGFKLYDVMIYAKKGVTFPQNNRYYSIFEYMFILSKGKPKTVNLIKDVKNIYAGQLKSSSTKREKDGSLTKRKSFVVEEYSIRPNIWFYDVGYMKTTTDKFAYQHPAMFPEALARDHIISWSNEEDIVLDPFIGSGTVAKMCERLNRKWIGIEINQSYCEIAKKRVLNEIGQAKLF